MRVGPYFGFRRPGAFSNLIRPTDGLTMALMRMTQVLTPLHREGPPPRRTRPIPRRIWSKPALLAAAAIVRRTRRLWRRSGRGGLPMSPARCAPLRRERATAGRLSDQTCDEPFGRCARSSRRSCVAPRGSACLFSLTSRFRRSFQVPLQAVTGIWGGWFRAPRQHRANPRVAGRDREFAADA